MGKLMKAVAAAVILFFIVLGLVIGSRMDQTTIALLGGTMIGLLIATPSAAIVTYLAIRNRDEHSNRPIHSYQQQPQPPQYWVVPQSQHLPAPTPHYNALPSNQYPAPFELPSRRKFYLIGDNGDATEITSDMDTGQP